MAALFLYLKAMRSAAFMQDALPQKTDMITSRPTVSAFCYLIFIWCELILLWGRINTCRPCQHPLPVQLPVLPSESLQLHFLWSEPSLQSMRRSAARYG